MSKLEFWFDPASTYSYVSAATIGALARQRGVTVEWRPFLLGPIFKAQGWNNSPFNLFPVKGRYMWRDMQRLCGRAGLPLAVPEADMGSFPRNSLLAARASLVAIEEGWGEAFVSALYRAEFADWLDIADPQVIASIAAAQGRDGEALLAAAGSEAVKARLRDNTAEAQRRGVFGAPTFLVGEELFWGSDRLDQALDWAAGQGEAA